MQGCCGGDLDPKCNENVPTFQLAPQVANLSRVLLFLLLPASDSEKVVYRREQFIKSRVLTLLNFAHFAPRRSGNHRGERGVEETADPRSRTPPALLVPGSSLVPLVPLVAL